MLQSDDAKNMAPHVALVSQKIFDAKSEDSEEFVGEIRSNNPIMSKDSTKNTSSFHKYLVFTQRLGPFIFPVAILLVLLLIVTQCKVNLLTLLSNPLATDAVIDQTPVDNYQFVDPTFIKGKSKEAYAFLLCTQPGAELSDQQHFEALQVSIYRLRKIQETIDEKKRRDIIVLICHLTPFDQYQAIKNLEVITVPVHTINPGFSYGAARWVNNYTKFWLWMFINWDRILYLDIDIYFMLDFPSIWDEPQTQPIEYPRQSSTSSFHGFELSDLHPYLFAASIDTWGWESCTKISKFNAGLFMMKPSLVHLHLLLRTAYDRSNHFAEMEQTTLNYIYNRTENGPLGFSEINATYNFFLETNPDFTDIRKAYHGKYWRTDLPETMKELGKAWQKDFIKMKDEYPRTVSIMLDKVNVYAQNDSIHINNLALSAGTGIFYAVASTNFTHKPTPEQIVSSFDIRGSYAPGGHASFIKDPVTLKISGLSSNTAYMIYYVATTSVQYAKYTLVSYIRGQTL